MFSEVLSAEESGGGRATPIWETKTGPRPDLSSLWDRSSDEDDPSKPPCSVLYNPPGDTPTPHLLLSFMWVKIAFHGGLMNNSLFSGKTSYFYLALFLQ